MRIPLKKTTLKEQISYNEKRFEELDSKENLSKEGKRLAEDIKIYEKGKEYVVFKPHYDPKYYKLLTSKK